MEIAQVCAVYYPTIGGVATHVKEISERLVKKGFEVEVLTTDPFGELLREEIINGVKVRRFRSWAPNEAYCFSRELKKHLMKNSDDYDIVHAHSYHAFPALYAAQAKKRNKLVFTPHYHGVGHTVFRSLLHTPYRFLWRKNCKKVDKIICVSNYEKSLIVKHLKIDIEKVVVIPNGINLQEFESLEKRRKHLRVILYVGRLEKYKGVHHLIEAVPNLDDNVRLEIVGKGTYKKSLVKLVRKLGVENGVKFFQDLPRKELLQKYVDADLFVFLSKHEAFGISVGEALTAKTPCVVANTSALKEWIDNRNCFGIDYPIDIEKLTKLINNVVWNGDFRRIKLLSWDKVVQRLIRVYSEIFSS